MKTKKTEVFGMAKRKNQWTEKKIAQYTKDGRGQGRGKYYKPWLRIQDVPSEGLVTRSLGWKTGRIHHFMSNLEMSYFYFLEWTDEVIDVREQFPLDREKTYEIAQDLGIKHPTDPKTGVPVVMTTDFLITLRHGKEEKFVARTIKPSEKLDDKRTIEKLQIEKEYWGNKGISWAIVTEKQLPKTMINNIKWLHASYYIDEEWQKSTHDIVCKKLKVMLGDNPDVHIMDLLTQIDLTYNLKEGTSLQFLMYLIAHKEVFINLNKQFQVHLFVSDCITKVLVYGDGVSNVKTLGVS